MTDSIPIADFRQLCMNPSVVDRVIDNWLRINDARQKKTLHGIGLGGGTALPRAQVKELFQSNVLTIDADKVNNTLFHQVEYDKFKAKHGLQDSDLGVD